MHVRVVSRMGWASLVGQWSYPPASEGDVGSIPGSGRSPGGGNGNPLQYSCLENPVDRGAWRVTVHGIVKVSHDLATPLDLSTRIKHDLNPLVLHHLLLCVFPH